MAQRAEILPPRMCRRRLVLIVFTYCIIACIDHVTSYDVLRRLHLACIDHVTFDCIN